MNARRGRLVALGLLPVALLAAGAVLWPLAVEEWELHALDSPDHNVREAAAAKLADMGAVRAIPRLLRILKSASALDDNLDGVWNTDGQVHEVSSGNGQILRWVMSGEHPASPFPIALEKLVSPRAVPQLIEALGDSDPPVVLWAVRRLAEHGRGSKSAAAALLETLRSGEKNFVLPIVCALGEIGDAAATAIPEVRKLLGDASDPLRTQCLATLVEIGDDVVPLLAARLTSPDPETRRWATSMLRDMGPAASPAVPALTAALGDADGLVASHAIAALGEIGPAASPALPALMRVLRGEYVTRHDLSGIFVRLGPASMPLILEELKTPDFYSRFVLVRAAGFFGPDGKAAVPAMSAALDDRDIHLRKVAAAALREVGAGAVEAVPALVRAVLDPDPELRAIAAGAIARIDPGSNAGLPVLLESLKNGPPVASIAAIDGLGKLGSAAAASIPAILDVLPSSALEAPAVRALARMGSAGAAAIGKLLHQGGDDFRCAALDALRDAEDSARLLVPELIDLLADPSAAIREKAATVLGEIGPPASAAVQGLLSALNDQEGIASIPVMRALSRLGSAASGAVAALAAVASRAGSSPVLRQEARAALRNIRLQAASPPHVRRWRELIDSSTAR
jgi:HEAT repeat protein